MTHVVPPWWQVLATGDLVAWTGLPDGLSCADVEERFPVAWPGEGTAFLGSEAVRTRFRVHDVDGFPEGVRVWDEDDVVVLLSGSLPVKVGPFRAVRAVWGPPVAQLGGQLGVLDLPRALHLYPDRGAAVLVGPEGQVLGLDLFVPGDLETYVQRLQFRDRTVEQP